MQTEAYGYWTSPITAEMTSIGEKSQRTTSILIENQNIYWTEARPLEKGRTVIMQYAQGAKVLERTLKPFDVRSKVHEYGGLAFTVLNDALYFVNKEDQALYVQTQKNEVPLRLTDGKIRIAEPLITPYGLIVIGEDNHQKNSENFLALVDLSSGGLTPLDRGHDFYASPTISPDGKKLAWLTWDHPHMPWDETKLWTAEIKDGKLVNKTLVAGKNNESIFQPRFSPKGTLFYISDLSGWWNLYRCQEGKSENIYPMEAEFGLPLWGLGTSTWCFTGKEEEILCSFQKMGIGNLALLDPLLLSFKILKFEGNDFSQLACNGSNLAAFLMGSPSKPRRVFQYNLHSHELSSIDSNLKQSIEDGFISRPQTITFPTSEKREAFGYFYPPQNKNYSAPSHTLPPLIVMSHGGPTAAADPVYNLRIQFWTSRGWSVLDVNYGGSSGFGREYRDRLKGQWGKVDVADCSNGALFLVHMGKVDPDKMVIRGGSAGGYTTLAALAFTKTFKAGASHYGVANLEMLAKDTHKFEAYYLETLVGPYPQCREEYVKRSPLYHAEQISCPVIFFQGGKDKIVPPNQAEVMYKALFKKGLKTEMVLYPEEEHGFRQASNIQDALERELKFYKEVLFSKNNLL